MELKHTHYDMLTLRSELLIVPYGIETKERGLNIYWGFAFNRTLWN